MQKFISLFLAVTLLLSTGLVGEVSLASACSIAAATGAQSADGRPVMWKNRDSWGTAGNSLSYNGWQVKPFYHTHNGAHFNHPSHPNGDRWGDRFNFTGITDNQSWDGGYAVGDWIPWSGINEKGLGLTMASCHNLKNATIDAHGYTHDQHSYGFDGGQLNFFILSRCQTVNEVEQFLRDTNDGGGFYNPNVSPTNPPSDAVISTARNTSCIIQVFDANGDMATFEVSGRDFVRDNMDQGYTYVISSGGYYNAAHVDDKNGADPALGAYSGVDWRANNSRVTYNSTGGFPYLVDTSHQWWDENGVHSTPGYPDGIHDWETSMSAVARYSRTADRLNNNRVRSRPMDYRLFIQKEVDNGTGIPLQGGSGNIETLARYIGDMSTTNTSLWPNRHVTTFSVVLKGTKLNDPYPGKLTTIWVALGEPSCSIFVPIFPFAGELPHWTNDGYGTDLSNMYTYTNMKRHQVYSYSNDDATGETTGRNEDRTIDTAVLLGGYYGQSGIQFRTFKTERYYFTQYDNFIAGLPAGLTDDQLRQQLRNFQNATCQAMKNYYITNTYPTGMNSNNPLSGKTNTLPVAKPSPKVR